ncbi:hypothetical protein HWV62_44909 [Athelia sp. TMB]|nr:hypothetical protein HWV62_44909 [Athelia sp. TMB]
MKSANILLKEAKAKPGLYTAEPIPLPAEPSVSALAFSLPGLLRQFGGRVRELALDSAWNTDGSRYEVYALLGEVYGSGIPLGYVLIRLDNAAPGAKERCICALLRYVRKEWNVCAIATLTDKDWGEINTFLAEYPEAKHQLCFWHCLRAIKKHLSILRRAPAHYNVAEAMKEFNFIKADFVPVGQSQDPKKPIYTTAVNTIPRLTIRLGGIIQPVTLTERERLTIKIPPKSASADLEDKGDLLDQVNTLLDKDKETDEEDAPDWFFEQDEIKSKDPKNVSILLPTATRGGLGIYVDVLVLPEDLADLDAITSGSITNGDDHVWTGNENVLSGGRWREITNGRLLSKCAREGDESDGDDGAWPSSPTPLVSERSSSPFIGHDADIEDELDIMASGLEALQTPPPRGS